MVERNEWLPEQRMEMTLDGLTGTRMGLFYARIPESASPEDGVLVRLSHGTQGSEKTDKKSLKNQNKMELDSSSSSHPKVLTGIL